MIWVRYLLFLVILGVVVGYAFKWISPFLLKWHKKEKKAFEKAVQDKGDKKNE